jgi:transposase
MCCFKLKTIKQMARPLPTLKLTAELQGILLAITRSRETPHSLVQRAQVVLSASEGTDNKAIGRRLALCEETVGFGRKRWLANAAGLEQLAGKPKQLREAVGQALADKPRPGCPGTFTVEQICRLLAVACETPPDHLSHWTQPELARAAANRGIVESISPSSVGRFLKSGRLKAPSGQILAEPRSRGRNGFPARREGRVPAVPSGAGTPRIGRTRGQR